MEIKQEQILNGKYKLINKIAQGGMNSEIWKAEMLKINNLHDYYFKKFCAIKIVSLINANDDLINNLEKELNTTIRARLKSNVFCEIYNWFWIEKDKKFAIVMEYIDGLPLNKYLKTRGMIPPVEAMNYFELILKAINHLHSMDNEGKEIILHRDLKLDNVMVTKDFLRIKIIDFGIASVMTQNDTGRTLKIEENSIYGSVPYLPPDIKNILDKKPTSEEHAKFVTEFWDIFSSGVILYVLLTGDFPYNTKEKDFEKNYLKPELYDFVPISVYVPDISPQIENIVYKCLVSIPNDKHHRYKKVNEILADIEKWKSNPHLKVELIKPIKERRIEKIENFIINQSKYEISSLFWNQTFITFVIVIILIIFTILILILL